MSATPAAQLARLRLIHPGWRFSRIPGLGFQAQHRRTGRRLTASTVGALDTRIIQRQGNGK